MGSQLVKVTDLKEGDKFYDLDGIIRIFISYIRVSDNSFTIYTIPFKRESGKLYIPTANTISSTPDIIENYKFYRYLRRDKLSYKAGFMMALRLCLEHMGKFDMENAGLDNPVNTVMKIDEFYKNWKENIIEI